MTVLRRRRVSTRPSDEPMFTKPTSMDFEKRRLVVPPSFIDRIVLQGGDEYVKASDIALIISAIIDELRPVLTNIETHLAMGSGEELSKEESE